MRSIICLILFFLFSDCKELTQVELVDGKPSLEVTVSHNRRLVESATVKLFLDKSNWKNDSSHDYSGITDENGVVSFENLETEIYYILVEKDTLDNRDGGVFYSNPFEINKTYKVIVNIK